MRIMTVIVALLCALVMGQAGATKWYSTAGQVVDGVTVTDAGRCVLITGANVTIKNSTIGPCGEMGIYVNGAAGVTLDNVKIVGAKDVCVGAYKARNLTIKNSTITNCMGGVYADTSSGVVITGNTLREFAGFPRGQCVQFNNVTGAGNLIDRNNCSRAEQDSINIFSSAGTQASPIVVSRNYLHNYENNPSTAGIIVGDGSVGAYISVLNNALIDGGPVHVAGGDHIVVAANVIKSSVVTRNRAAISAFKYLGRPCTNISIMGNTVSWVGTDGTISDATGYADPYNVAQYCSFAVDPRSAASGNRMNATINWVSTAVVGY